MKSTILAISALLIFASVTWGQMSIKPGVDRGVREDRSTPGGLMEITQNREPQSSSSQQSNQSSEKQSGEWHKFSTPRTTNQGQPANNSSRPPTSSPRYTGPSGPQSQRPTSNHDASDWRHFPSPRSSDQPRTSNSRPVDRPNQPANNSQNDPYRHFPANDRPNNSAPPNRSGGSSAYDRGYTGGGAPRPPERGNAFQPPARESRPPLQMGHPVVTPRNSQPPARSSGHSTPPSNGHPHR